MEPYRPSKYWGSGNLFEFYYLVESNFRAIAMSSCIEMGGAFSENYNLIPSSYNWGGERYLHNIPLQIWIFTHAMKLKLEPVEWSFIKRGNKWRHKFSHWLFTHVRPSRSDVHVDHVIIQLDLSWRNLRKNLNFIIGKKIV